MVTDQEICRICFDYYDLISPCDCRGTSKYVHEFCLQQWRAKIKSYKCEICNAPYKPVRWNSTVLFNELLSISFAF